MASLDYRLQTERIQRRNQFRTVTVGAYPAEGKLPSDVLGPLMGKLRDFEHRLPLGYRMEFSGDTAPGHLRGLCPMSDAISDSAARPGSRT